MKLLTAKEEVFVGGGLSMSYDDFRFFAESICRDYRKMEFKNGGVSFPDGAKFWNERIGYLRGTDCELYKAVVEYIGWRVPCFADYPV